MRDEGRTILFVTHDMQRGQPLLPSRRCCSSAARWSRSATRRRSPGSTWRSTSAQERGADATELTGELDDRAAYVAGRLVRGRARRAARVRGAGDAVVCKVRVEFNWDAGRPGASRSRSRATAARRAFATSSAWTGRRTGRFAAGEQVVFSVAVRQLPRARAATTSRRRSRCSRARTRASSTAATAPPRSSSPGAADTSRRPSVPHDFSVERVGVARAVGVSARRRAGGWSAAAARPTERRRFFQITVALAVTEFKIRYFGSVLGYLWSLMRPLMVFGVLYVVFTHVVRFGGDIEHYPLKLLLAIVLWSYFAEATGQALDVARATARACCARSRSRPPSCRCRSGSRRAFNLGLNLCVVLVFVLVTGIAPAACVARADAAGRAAARPDRRGLDAARGAVRAVPGHGADLGGRHADAVLGHADHLRDRDRARERAGAADDEPARGDHRAGAARGDRPVGADARPRRSAAPRCC